MFHQIIDIAYTNNTAAKLKKVH